MNSRLSLLALICVSMTLNGCCCPGWYGCDGYSSCDVCGPRFPWFGGRALARAEERRALREARRGCRCGRCGGAGMMMGGCSDMGCCTTECGVIVGDGCGGMSISGDVMGAGTCSCGQNHSAPMMAPTPASIPAPNAMVPNPTPAAQPSHTVPQATPQASMAVPSQVTYDEFQRLPGVIISGPSAAQTTPSTASAVPVPVPQQMTSVSQPMAPVPPLQMAAPKPLPPTTSNWVPVRR